jgi:hypothetical protein
LANVAGLARVRFLRAALKSGDSSYLKLNVDKALVRHPVLNLGSSEESVGGKVQWLGFPRHGRAKEYRQRFGSVFEMDRVKFDCPEILISLKDKK